VIEEGERVKLSHDDDRAEGDDALPEITKLTEQLLFTWGQLKEQAQAIGSTPFKIAKHQDVLDEMMSDAKKMDLVLLDLKKAIEAL
jgi:hypothetical protein